MRVLLSEGSSLIGAAERTGSRTAALRALATGLGRRNELRGSREVLTPLPADPLSLIPVLIVASQLLVAPGRAQALASGAVRDYAVPPGAIDVVRLLACVRRQEGESCAAERGTA